MAEHKRVEASKEQYDKSVGEKYITLADETNGRSSQWRQKAGDWKLMFQLISSGMVLLGILGGFGMSLHKFAVKPIREDISKLNAKIDTATNPTRVTNAAQSLEGERARLNPTAYTPIPDERIEYLINRAYVP